MKQSSIISKLILVIAAIIIAGCGWYFLYWRNTPAFAAGEIQQAVQRKDFQLFEKRVDLEKVYGYAIDDAVSLLSNDGVKDHRLAATILSGLKGPAVQELIRQTEIRFNGGDVKKSMLDKPVQTLSAYVGSQALSLTDIFDVQEKDGKALCHVKLHDKDLGRDFTWEVEMEKDVNGNWNATRVVNFKEYLQERMEAKKNSK